MNELKFVTAKNNRKHHKLLESIMLPYCHELDGNISRETPDTMLKKFIASIVSMAEDKDRFVELCYLGKDLIGFAYGKIDSDEHRGYVRPGWGYVMEFYVKPEFRRSGYGRKIYKHLENIFKSNGVSNIWLTADPVTGEPFWKAVGFTNSGEKSPENNLYIYEKSFGAKMITLTEYLNNPCGTLSIPYWKAKNIVIPPDMMILHDKDFSADVLSDYTDEQYFRLYHNLKEIPHIIHDDFEIAIATRKDIKSIVQIINDSYTDLSVNKELIKSYAKTPVYNADLWVMVKDKATGKYVGCGIADFDTEAKELILEWIQVLPQYRGKKIGQLIVTELLFRMKDVADFATVSGKVDNMTNPEALYRKCGFVGDDVWHILHKK